MVAHLVVWMVLLLAARLVDRSAAQTVSTTAVMMAELTVGSTERTWVERLVESWVAPRVVQRACSTAPTRVVSWAVH